MKLVEILAFLVILPLFLNGFYSGFGNLKAESEKFHEKMSVLNKNRAAVTAFDNFCSAESEKNGFSKTYEDFSRQVENALEVEKASVIVLGSRDGKKLLKFSWANGGETFSSLGVREEK